MSIAQDLSTALHAYDAALEAVQPQHRRGGKVQFAFDQTTKLIRVSLTMPYDVAFDASSGTIQIIAAEPSTLVPPVPAKPAPVVIPNPTPGA